MPQQKTAHATWKDCCQSLNKILAGLEVTDFEARQLDGDEAFAALFGRTQQVKEARKTIFWAGNGASAGIAGHGAADLMKNGGLKTVTLTDPALVTAWGNDLSYHDVFSGPLGICLTAGDMLALISSSGNSPNIVKAAHTGHAHSAFVVTFSAMSADNTLRTLGDLNFYLPASTYGLAESGHTLLLHHWIDRVIANKENYIDK